MPSKSWLGLYHGVTHSASLGDDRVWTISYYSGSNEIAEARVSDTLMALQGVRTGPQVGWMLARGLPGSYGRLVNRWWLFLPLCAIFMAGLMNWRRPISLRTLDLLVLISFGVSLIFFDHANLFWATPLVYPPMIYLIVRGVQVGFSHTDRSVDIGPTHALVLVALTFGLIGFRLGLNNQDSNILDVGYASVVGADRILHTTIPYGHMPSTTDARAVASTATATRSGTSRVTATASRPSAQATRTGRRCIWPTCPQWRRWAGAASGTACRRRMSPPARSICSRSPGCSWPGGGLPTPASVC